MQNYPLLESPPLTGLAEARRLVQNAHADECRNRAERSGYDSESGDRRLRIVRQHRLMVPLRADTASLRSASRAAIVRAGSDSPATRRADAATSRLSQPTRGSQCAGWFWSVLKRKFRGRPRNGSRFTYEVLWRIDGASHGCRRCEAPGPDRHTAARSDRAAQAMTTCPARSHVARASSRCRRCPDRDRSVTTWAA
jgi:hypothetical protein